MTSNTHRPRNSVLNASQKSIAYCPRARRLQHSYSVHMAADVAGLSVQVALDSAHSSSAWIHNAKNVSPTHGLSATFTAKRRSSLVHLLNKKNSD